MERKIFTQEEFTKIAPAFERGGVQFYSLRVNPQPIEEGKIVAIEDVFNHYPTEEDEKALYDAWLAMERRVKVVEIEQFAKTDSVKVFEVNGVSGWLDSEERGSIRRAASDKAAEGRDVFTLYLSGHGIEMKPTEVEDILKVVEIYASDCFDHTEAHKLAVNALAVIEDVQNYDISAGYPAHPVFNV